MYRQPLTSLERGGEGLEAAGEAQLSGGERLIRLATLDFAAPLPQRSSGSIPKISCTSAAWCNIKESQKRAGDGLKRPGER